MTQTEPMQFNINAHGYYMPFYIYRLAQGFIINHEDKTYIVRDLDDLHKTMATILVEQRLEQPPSI